MVSEGQGQVSAGLGRRGGGWVVSGSLPLAPAAFPFHSITNIVSLQCRYACTFDPLLPHMQSEPKKKLTPEEAKAAAAELIRK